MKTAIENRFKQYQVNNVDKLDDLTLIYKLYEEIMKIYPSIDSDFYNECNLIINMIKNSVTKTNSENLAHELNVSSENNLKYLKEIINGQFYWDLEKRDSIENSHINFLEKEFYSIIAEFYSKRDYPHVLKCCQSILQNKIEKDIKIIKKYFTDLENNAAGNHSNDNDISKPITMLDEMNKRTDFSIRESERVREIKVVVEEGHLVNEIEQDF